LLPLLPLKEWLIGAVDHHPQGAKEGPSEYARRLYGVSPPHLKKRDWQTFRNTLYRSKLFKPR
jgi:hypothetical protein